MEREPRHRNYKIIGFKLDKILEVLDQRLAAAVQSFPELEALIDAIDAARPVLERAGMLKSQWETRKAQAAMAKKAG